MTTRTFPRSRYVLYVVVALVCLLADLVTKSLVFAQCGLPGERATYWLIPDILGFQTSLNEGAVFGMGQGFTFLFSGMSLLALGLLWFWLFYAKNATSRLWTVTLAMMTGGILGNLYDRLGLHRLTWDWFFIPYALRGGEFVPIHQVGDPVYAVRDWILVMIGSYHWPNFNLADSYLVVGMILICLDLIFRKEKN